MKKNILLVQTFLILPLMSSSLIFSMDQTYAAVTQRGTQLPQQQLRHSSTKKRNNKKKSQTRPQQQPQALVTSENSEIAPAQQIAQKNYFSDEDKTNAERDLEIAKNYVNDSSGLYDLLLTIQSLSNENGLSPVSITTSLPGNKTSVDMNGIKIEVSEDLADSILSPSERTELGISQRIWNAWKSNRAIAIELLTNKTFETNNATHTEYFNKALEECAQQKDIASLKAIMDACQAKEYKHGMQSAINHVAPVFNYLCDEYQAQINTSNTALIAFNQQCAEQMNEESARLKENLKELLNQHRDSVSAMAKAFETKTNEETAKINQLKNLVGSVSALNRKTVSNQNHLFFALPLVVPTNSVGKIEDKTHQNVRHLLTHSSMPQAKPSILQIDNK